MRAIKVLVLSLFVFVLFTPRFAQAQTGNVTLSDRDLARVIFSLYDFEVTTNIAAGGNSSAAFDNLAQALVLTGAISDQLSTFPLGSSAGGFTWSFDPGVGIYTRSSSSYGPLATERALTLGRKKANFGLTFQRASFDKFEGRDLKNREVAFYTPFTSTLIGEDALSLDVTTNTVTLFGNYGVTDRLDVGVVLPIVKTSLEADLHFKFLNASGAQSGTFQYSVLGGGSKSGLGDVVLRSKYRLVNLRGGGVAAGLDLRLPTGDEKNLLGLPGSQAKIYGIVSGQAGMVSPHVNIGYTVSRASDVAKDPTYPLLEPNDELNFSVGVDLAAMPKLTIAGDIINRTLRDAPKLALEGSTPFQELKFTGIGNLNLPLASVGAKFEAMRNLLISVNVLFPLNDSGLRDKFTPSFGFDYSF